MTGNLALKLVEGTKADRDQYIDRVEVLRKVKKLVLLNDSENMTVDMVSEFYEVESKTISMLILRHRDELENDGLKVLRKQELKAFKVAYLHHVVKLKTIPQLTIIPRRAILRIGMLLTESPVAEKVRDYLLRVEEKVEKETRIKAVKKYKGVWTEEIQDFVLKTVYLNELRNVAVSPTLNQLSKELGISYYILQNRWYGRNGNAQNLKNLYEAQKNNFEGINVPNFEQKISRNNAEEKINDDKLLSIIKNQYQILDKVIVELNELKESNSQLHTDMGRVWRSNQELNELSASLFYGIKEIKDEINEHNKLVNETFITKVNLIEKKAKNLSKKLKVSNEELEKAKRFIADNIVFDQSQKDDAKPLSFKMDRNGNLTKINK